MITKILFVHSGDEFFTKIDIDLLKKSFDVKDFYVPQKFPFHFLSYLHNIARTELVFCWFGSWNCFWAILIAKLLRKRSVLVVGGYDIANVPEANYGNQRGGIMKWVTRFAMRLATRLITFSVFSKEDVRKNIGGIADKIEVIYLGVPDNFGDFPIGKRVERVITVGGVTMENLVRKGLVPFVKTAALLPDLEFVLIGKWFDASIDILRSIATPNVKFSGRISDIELNNYFKSSSVYVQASVHEGFGLSVAEAMLGGCVPICTKIGSLPEVVGDSGIYITHPEPSETEVAIHSALSFGMIDRKKIRNRILISFPLSDREMKIRELIKSM